MLGENWEGIGKCVCEEGRMERRGKFWVHRRRWQYRMGKVGGRRLLVTKARDKFGAEGEVVNCWVRARGRRENQNP